MVSLGNGQRDFNPFGSQSEHGPAPPGKVLPSADSNVLAAPGGGNGWGAYGGGLALLALGHGAGDGAGPDHVRRRLTELPPPDWKPSLLDGAGRLFTPEADPSCSAPPEAADVGLQPGNLVSVIVAPRAPTGELVLAVRYSIAAGRWTLEMPRHDDEHEDEGWRSPAEESLARCGFAAAGKMSLAGALRLDPPSVSSSLIVIVAEDCRLDPHVPPPRDALFAGAALLAPSVVYELAREGDVECVRTLAALIMLRG